MNNPEESVSNDYTKTVCQIADELVSADRQAAYGHPVVNFTQIAEFLNIAGYRKEVKGELKRLGPEDVPMIMIFTKLSRELHKHKRDNLVDCVGYVKTLDQVLEHQDKTSKKIP